MAINSEPAMEIIWSITEKIMLQIVTWSVKAGRTAQHCRILGLTTLTDLGSNNK